MSLVTNYPRPSSNIVYTEYQASLENGSEIDSGWIDMSHVDKVQFSGLASVAGMTSNIMSRADENQTALETPVTYTEGNFYLFNIICRQRYMRFKWINNTGSTREVPKDSEWFIIRFPVRILRKIWRLIKIIKHKILFP